MHPVPVAAAVWIGSATLFAHPLGNAALDLRNSGTRTELSSWRFSPLSASGGYRIQFRLRDPVGRELIRTEGDPRFAIWYGEAPVVDIAIFRGAKRVYSVQSSLDVAASGSATRPATGC
jgi:hypothetical protein